MGTEIRKKNVIVEITFNFSLEIILLTEQLDGMKKYSMSRQLFRSATSIGANVREAQNAESMRDFIHKMKIAAKEADETQYWLMLCDHSESYPNCKNLLGRIAEIQKILTTIISTSRKTYNLSR